MGKRSILNQNRFIDQFLINWKFYRHNLPNQISTNYTRLFVRCQGSSNGMLKV